MLNFQVVVRYLIKYSLEHVEKAFFKPSTFHYAKNKIMLFIVTPIAERPQSGKRL